ncbi:MAG: hypothetical protein IH624_08040 [Phycisphaerae bacterium]|nr:hypothetical protein [Phycisphaerae bacterium]
MITFECDKCDRNYQVADGFAGKDVLCKNCKTLLTVPLTDRAKHDTWFDPNYDTSSIFMSQNYDLIQALLKQEREAPALAAETVR